MGRSHVNRRQRERPLRELRAKAGREVDEFYDKHGGALAANERAELIDDLVRLADPWAYRGIDAPLPAHLCNLRRAWIALHHAGLIRTPANRERFARLLAPAPDYDYNQASTMDRNFDACPGYVPVLQACRSIRRRRGIPDGDPTFPTDQPLLDN